MEENIIEYVCPRCGNGRSIVKKYDTVEFGECTSCHRLTFQNEFKINPDKCNIVHCPYCNSINTTKISTLSKVGSVALWGVFAAGKVSKQWHCNNCKSDF